MTGKGEMGLSCFMGARLGGSGRGTSGMYGFALISTEEKVVGPPVLVAVMLAMVGDGWDFRSDHDSLLVCEMADGSVDRAGMRA